MGRNSKRNKRQKRDIIKKLYERKMDDYLYQMFRYLDVNSMKNAALVSKQWRDAIALVRWKNKIHTKALVSEAWRDMAVMVRQSVKPDLLEKKLGDQLVYHLIVENLKKLEHNWNYGIWMGKKFSIFLSPPCLVQGLRPGVNRHLFPSHVNHAYAMSCQYNVTADSNSKITIRNKFGVNEIIKVLDIPSIPQRPLPSDAPQRPLIYSIKINNRFIAVSFYYHAEVCVWNAETLELVKVLDGDLFDSKWINHHNSWHSICLYEDHLITFHGEGTKIICTRYSLDHDDAEALKRHPLDFEGNVRSVRDCYMDDVNICILFASQSGGFDGGLTVETRSFSDFDKVISNIDLQPLASSLCPFHYFGGIICVADFIYKIRFWDVKSGALITSFSLPYGTGIVSDLKMIENKFLVFCNLEGSLNIWNLTKILDSKREGFAVNREFDVDFHVAHIPSHKTAWARSHLPHPSLQVVNKLQIGLAAQFNFETFHAPLYYSLYTFDFVGDWEVTHPHPIGGAFPFGWFTVWWREPMCQYPLPYEI